MINSDSSRSKTSCCCCLYAIYGPVDGQNEIATLLPDRLIIVYLQGYSEECSDILMKIDDQKGTKTTRQIF